jgi:glycerol kinase
MQFQADMLNTKVCRPVVAETTALGAAYLAGLAVGYWRDISDVADHWVTDRVFEPSAPDEWRDAHYARWQKAVSRSRGWEEDRRE